MAPKVESWSMGSLYHLPQHHWACLCCAWLFIRLALITANVNINQSASFCWNVQEQMFASTCYKGYMLPLLGSILWQFTAVLPSGLKYFFSLLDCSYNLNHQKNPIIFAKNKRIRAPLLFLFSLSLIEITVIIPAIYFCVCLAKLQYIIKWWYLKRLWIDII